VTFRTPIIERALLGYVLVVVGLLTLAPFRFAWPAEWGISWSGDRADAPANFLFFLPVGYFFRLALPRHSPHAILSALLFGSGISFAIEFLQLFLPARGTSVFDLLGNGLGGAAGAVLCDAVRRRLDRALPIMLTLEHPLLNLVYLSLPLMWLAGVGVEATPARVWLLLPLGAAGTLTLAGLWRYRFAGATTLPRSVLIFAVMAWFLFGAVAGLNIAPLIVARCAIAILAFILVLLFLRGALNQPRGRFEHKVLATVWPCYLVYLLMLVLWPHHHSFVAFDFALGYPEYGFDRAFTIRIAEQLGALTLFGYLVAESFGRSVLSRRVIVARNVAFSAVCALILEILHGFLPGDRASIARFLLGVIAAGFGVMLYVAQLNVVHVLRGKFPRDSR
jgi:glycopeptide antibiotics resistance protein